MLTETLKACLETVEMVFISGAISLVVGVPLGVILSITKTGHLWPNRWINLILGSIVNAFRSIPFIILFIAIMPFTRLIVKKTIGVPAAIVALTIAAIPFFARTVEIAINEVHEGLIEAAKSLGATRLQIITKVLIPESSPGIVGGLTLTLVNLVGYSAMTGFTGTGGLGAMAINHGYFRYDTKVILITVLILMLMVQLIQVVGDYVAKKLISN